MRRDLKKRKAYFLLGDFIRSENCICLILILVSLAILMLDYKQRWQGVLYSCIRNIVMGLIPSCLLTILLTHNQNKRERQRKSSALFDLCFRLTQYEENAKKYNRGNRRVDGYRRFVKAYITIKPLHDEIRRAYLYHASFLNDNEISLLREIHTKYSFFDRLLNNVLSMCVLDSKEFTTQAMALLQKHPETIKTLNKSMSDVISKIKILEVTLYYEGHFRIDDMHWIDKN